MENERARVIMIEEVEGRWLVGLSLLKADHAVERNERPGKEEAYLGLRLSPFVTSTAQDSIDSRFKFYNPTR